ncbi:hypothetical protein [Acrocarpospora pleiomorpha]|uniref:hypothetical protein n=1 Tax=Acrocarpospora pleiomorpha TaxID=90975 RepID=UPI0012D2CE62|nr:hypothetical protein [Acrocarpospora pleiomorpha]
MTLDPVLCRCAWWRSSTAIRYAAASTGGSSGWQRFGEVQAEVDAAGPGGGVLPEHREKTLPVERARREVAEDAANLSQDLSHGSGVSRGMMRVRG